DATGNLDRLDLTCWESLVTQDPDGMDVISSIKLDEEEIDGARIREVLDFTRSIYAWTVLDLGRLNHKSIALLAPDHEVFVVTNSTIPALYAAKRAIEALRVAAIDTDRIRLIVNHVGEKALVSGEA